MELTPDELAGVVDVVGPVTRDELVGACGELAFKRGEQSDDEAVEAAIEAALSTYHLVEVGSEARDATERGDDGGDEAPLVVVGPAAFPALPEGAEDLPHIMEIAPRVVDSETRARAAEQRFREDAAEAVREGDGDRIRTLLDVSYDLEAWGPVELATARGRLDEATQAN